MWCLPVVLLPVFVSLGTELLQGFSVALLGLHLVLLSMLGHGLPVRLLEHHKIEFDTVNGSFSSVVV